MGIIFFTLHGSHPSLQFAKPTETRTPQRVRKLFQHLIIHSNVCVKVCKKPQVVAGKNGEPSTMGAL
jgi:hypothetical protein